MGGKAMREIKFRGRSVDSDELVYGNYLGKCDEDESYDCIESVTYIDGAPNFHVRYAVFRETVGQYTGINDCNNVEIYDGDICVDSKDNVIRIMQTNSYQWGCKVIKADNVSIRGLTFPLWQWDDDRKFKKVGNIYENQELMESEK